VKVKLFIKDKSMFGNFKRMNEDLENEINAWLAENPDVKIVHVQQSSNGGSLDTTKVIMSVWYEPGK
jgi:hypothetical protein